MSFFHHVFVVVKIQGVCPSVYGIRPNEKV